MSIKYHKLYPTKKEGESFFADLEFESLLHDISVRDELYTDEINHDLKIVYIVKNSLEYLRKKYGIVYNISL